MTKTDLPYKTAGDLRLGGGGLDAARAVVLMLVVVCDLLVTHHAPAIDDFKNYMGDVWFCFRHNYSKKLSPGPN